VKMGGRLASSQLLPLLISAFVIRMNIFPSCLVGSMFMHHLLERRMLLFKSLVSGLSGCCTDMHRLSVSSKIPTTGMVAREDK